jgi:Predicted transcription regulator containing HTH domain
MMADPDTPEGEKLDVMVTLIEAYEAKQFPMELPDPVEAIKFEMERKGLTVKDLEPMIGKSNRVYEILNHKRSLTLMNFKDTPTKRSLQLSVCRDQRPWSTGLSKWRSGAITHGEAVRSQWPAAAYLATRWQGVITGPLQATAATVHPLRFMGWYGEPRLKWVTV